MTEEKLTVPEIKILIEKLLLEKVVQVAFDIFEHGEGGKEHAQLALLLPLLGYTSDSLKEYAK